MPRGTIGVAQLYIHDQFSPPPMTAPRKRVDSWALFINLREPWRRTMIFLIRHFRIEPFFLLYLAKEIADVAWLLLSNLFVFAMIGEWLEITKMKQLCINGPALTTRARQLTWRLQQNMAAKINAAPGAHSVAKDDTEIAAPTGPTARDERAARRNLRNNAPA
jgi:hypothetical protein